MTQAKEPKKTPSTPTKQAGIEHADSAKAIGEAGHPAHPDRSVQNPHPAEKAPKT